MLTGPCSCAKNELGEAPELGVAMIDDEDGNGAMQPLGRRRRRQADDVVVATTGDDIGSRRISRSPAAMLPARGVPSDGDGIQGRRGRAVGVGVVASGRRR